MNILQCFTPFADIKDKSFFWNAIWVSFLEDHLWDFMTVRMVPVYAVVSETAHKILKQILHDLASVFVYDCRGVFRWTAVSWLHISVSHESIQFDITQTVLTAYLICQILLFCQLGAFVMFPVSSPEAPNTDHININRFDATVVYL